MVYFSSEVQTVDRRFHGWDVMHAVQTRSNIEEVYTISQYTVHSTACCRKRVENILGFKRVLVQYT